MVALCAWRDARSDKLDVVEVYDVEVLCVQALQRATHAAAYGGGGVVKVGCAGTVTSHFGEELVGAAREFVLEGFQGGAEHDLGVVVVRRRVEGANTVSV